MRTTTARLADPLGPMTDLDDLDAAVDEGVARRQRNVDAVIDVVLELFAEDAMFPTME